MGFVGAKIVGWRHLVLMGLPSDLVGGGGLDGSWGCFFWALLFVDISMCHCRVLRFIVWFLR